MRKDHKKRGRRGEEKKRKHEGEYESSSKRHHKEATTDDGDVHMEGGEDYSQHEDLQGRGAAPPDDMPFYGMLDEEEQEYFKRADNMLELNQFEDPEERALLLENVFREAEGKELKIANSQSCSRLLERMILLSTPDQLKSLFQKFSGHFLNLVQHRFASHCCEALFIAAAPIVTQEMKKDFMQTPPSSDPNAVYVSMENVYLYALAELEGYLGFLMTDRFASHVLRVLLIVFAGLPLPKQDSRSVLQSKKKEKITVSGLNTQEGSLEKRAVPQSFTQALEKIINDSLSGLDPAYLRALATHDTGNPMLQLLLQLELSHFGKSRAKDEKSIIHRLLPDDPITEGTESAAFINGLLYSPVGSRLLETIVEFAPGKMFKTIYREVFKERMGTLARNEIAGYVAGKILERLSKEDLEDAMQRIVEQIPMLVERSRTAVLKTLIERCVVRGVNMRQIAVQFETAYSGSNGFEITRLLKLADPSPEEEKKPATSQRQQPNPDKVHGSLLAQAMMTVPGPLSDLVFDSLSQLGTPLSLQVARDPIATRTLQAALKSPNASIIFRRKMIQQFYGHIGELALDPAGSHFIDAVWEGTQGLAFIRERIAEELAENEGAMRESFVGRAVWRNWQMDLYKRRRADWVKESKFKAGNDGFQSFPETVSNGNASTKPKNGKKLSGIELARQRHAAIKAAQAKKEHQDSKAKGKEKEPVAA